MPTLYVVATPIGNLGDLSPRAREVLTSVALIAAEDTRVTQKLLSAFDIHTPLTSCHEHNERGKASQIVARMLDENIDVAVTTDAGTPCISDPGSILVHEAVKAGIEAVAVPGPTAMASALSVSGLELSEFTFFGFPPRAAGELRDKLKDMARRSEVAVLHESPHRVTDLVAAVAEQFPHTFISASCDLTKKHEKTLRGLAPDVLEQLRSNEKTEKGEYCLVLKWDPAEKPAEEQPKSDLSLEARLFDGMVRGLSLRESMQELQEQGERKNTVYAASLHLKEIING